MFDFKNKSIFSINNIILSLIWTIITIVLIVMLQNNVRDTEKFEVLRYILQSIYVLVFWWYLHNRNTSIKDDNSESFDDTWIRKYAGILTVILFLSLIIFTDFGTPLLLLFMIISSIFIIIFWRRKIQLKSIVWSLIFMMVALIGGYPHMTNGFISKDVYIILLIFVPVMFVAGGLLIKQSNLGKIQVLNGNITKAIKSFLLGCILFIPLGLFNSASGSPGNEMDYVSSLWMPFTLPLFSGIAEEVWYRLFLISIVYIMLIPLFRKQRNIAILIAIFFSAITFGLGHGRSFDSFFVTGLLYGLPMSIIFVKRDIEHAIGAHYMINMIPTFYMFLGI